MIYASDKRIVNGPVCNQLYPFKYEWAWKSYKSAKKNHWMPDEINMARDVLQFNTQLDPVQTHVYTNVLAYLSTADIMALRNVSLAVMEKVTAPEVQAYLATQAAEEAVHSHAYQHCLETLGLDGNDIYNRYHTVPAIAQKIEAANARINAMLRPGLDLKNRDDLEEFMMGYAFFAAVFEGVWFYNGFSPLFALARAGLMTGTAEQLQFILRDECLTPDHEVLTPEGWKPIGELDGDDMVLQAAENGNHSFVRPSRLVCKEYSGPVYRFHNEQGHFDQRVTPNHRMVTLSKTGKLRDGIAEETKPHGFMWFVCNFSNEQGETLGLSPEEQLAVVFQADGATPRKLCDGSRTGHVLTSFEFSKERKVERFKEILRGTGFNYTETGVVNGKSLFRVEIPVDRKWIIDKGFGWVDLLTVGYDWCKDFLEEVAEWDGSRAAANRIRYDNTRGDAADVVQAVATMAGYRVLRKVIHDERKESYKDVHRVYVVKDCPVLRGGAVMKDEEFYEGKVYCVTVPTGMFFVRRNSSVSVTGNCLHFAFGIKCLNTISEEENIQLDPKALKDMFLEAEATERTYIEYILKDPLRGYALEDHMEQSRFLMNRRARALRTYLPFEGAKPALPWLDEMAGGTRKEKNFFETRVTEYQTGGLGEYPVAPAQDIEEEWDLTKRAAP